MPAFSGPLIVGSVSEVVADLTGAPTIEYEWTKDGAETKAVKGVAIKPSASAEGATIRSRLKITWPSGEVAYTEWTEPGIVGPATVKAAPIKAAKWPALYGTGAGTNELLSTYVYNGKASGAFYVLPAFEAVPGSMAGYDVKSGMGPRGEGMGPAGYASFAGDTATDDMVVAHIRAALKPGKEISAQGGYATQHDAGWLAAVFFAQNAPRIWAKFSADEQALILLIVEAAFALLASATREEGEGWKTHLGSSNSSTLIANPNIGSASRLVVVICAAIMGGAQAGDALLKSYASEAKLKALYDRLVAAGVKNTAASLNPQRASGAPTYAQMVKKLANWTSRGFSLLECDKLLAAEIDFACSEECASEVPSRVAALKSKATAFPGVGKILGKVSAPLKALLGKRGMFLELRGFDDANGQGIGDRSSPEYNMKAVRVMTIGTIVPIVAGMVDPKSAVMKPALAKLAIGLAHFREITRDSVGWDGYAQAGRKMSGPWGWTLMTSGQSEQWGILPWFALGDVIEAIATDKPVQRYEAAYFADA